MREFLYNLDKIYPIGRIKFFSNLGGQQNIVYLIRSQKGEFILKILKLVTNKKI